jgi:hypothetical protein
LQGLVEKSEVLAGRNQNQTSFAGGDRWRQSFQQNPGVIETLI